LGLFRVSVPGLQKTFPPRTKNPPQFPEKCALVQISISPVSELLSELTYTGKALRVIWKSWGVPGSVQASHPPSDTTALEFVIDARAGQGVGAEGLPWRIPGRFRQLPACSWSSPGGALELSGTPAYQNRPFNEDVRHILARSSYWDDFRI
jgi:hypothetical protein